MLKLLKRIYKRVYQQSTPENWKLAGDCVLWGLQGTSIIEFCKENHTAGIIVSIIGMIAKFLASIPVDVSKEKKNVI